MTDAQKIIKAAGIDDHDHLALWEEGEGRFIVCFECGGCWYLDGVEVRAGTCEVRS